MWLNEIFWKGSFKVYLLLFLNKKAMTLFTCRFWNSNGASTSLLQCFMEHPLFIHTVPLLNFRCKQQRLLCISHYLILTTLWSPKPKQCGILPSSHFLLLVGCVLPAFSIYSSWKTTYLLIKTCFVHFLLTFWSLVWAKIVFSGTHFKYNFSSNYAYIR